VKVEQWPVATRGQVAGAFKNLADEAAGEAPFRTLRHRGWATAGTRLRTRSGGHITGGIVIYCSLNVDAARLARLGFQDEAADLAAEALKVETSDPWRHMVEMLAAGSDDEARDAVSGVVRRDALGELLRSVSRLTERARDRHKVLTRVYEITIGAVSQSLPGYVVVHTTAGEDTAVPRWLAAGVARDKPGDLVALLHERLGARKAILEAVPAIDVEDAGDGSGYSPFDRADPRNRLSTADAAYLRGEPAPLRVLVPVTIEG
jgi:hypothetical protein